MYPEITGLKKNGRKIMERFKYDIKWFDRELNRIGSPIPVVSALRTSGAGIL